jgi:hypothetical protein
MSEVDVIDEPDTDEYDFRGLVLSGGKPYILMVVEDETTGEVSLSSAGVIRDAVPLALRQLADQLEASIVEEAGA